MNRLVAVLALTIIAGGSATGEEMRASLHDNPIPALAE